MDISEKKWDFFIAHASFWVRIDHEEVSAVLSELRLRNVVLRERT